MNLDKQIKEEYDTIYRYKKSILLDSFICVAILFPIMIFSSKYIFSESSFSRTFFYLIMLVFFAIFFCLIKYLRRQV